MRCVLAPPHYLKRLALSNLFFPCGHGVRHLRHSKAGIGKNACLTVHD
jgi:hypothetical protein